LDTTDSEERLMKNIFNLFTLLLITCFTTAAFAAETKIKVELRSLEGQIERNQLHVAYEVSPRSWQTIQKAGIQPELKVFEATKNGRQKLLYSVVLRRPNAELTLPKSLKIQQNDRLTVSIEGQRGRSKVIATSLGRSTSRMIPLAIAQPARDNHSRDRDEKFEKQRPRVVATVARRPVTKR